MNNFEKIKQMNIYELAEFITIENYCLYCRYDMNNCENKDCIEGVKQWLQSESED